MCEYTVTLTSTIELEPGIEYQRWLDEGGTVVQSLTDSSHNFIKMIIDSSDPTNNYYEIDSSSIPDRGIYEIILTASLDNTFYDPIE